MEIVEQLARDKVVEEMVRRITRGPSADGLNANGKDLAQMVYEVLLTYDEDKVVDLYESGALGFFIVRVIKLQAFSPRSTFYYTIRRFSARSEDITGKDVSL